MKEEGDALPLFASGLNCRHTDEYHSDNQPGLNSCFDDSQINIAVCGIIGDNQIVPGNNTGGCINLRLLDLPFKILRFICQPFVLPVKYLSVRTPYCS